MFNFFKNSNINKKIPDDYKHLLNQRAYEEMIDTILQYFKEKGEPVLKVGEGYVVTKPIKKDGEGREQRYGLDNLVRAVASAKQENRKSIIYTHFNRADFNMRPLEYFKTDYELAKQYLKILIKPEQILRQQGGADVVYKTVFPGTVSVLVFDYDNKFNYLYYHLIKGWGKTDDELFAEALNNIAREDLKITGLNLVANDYKGEVRKATLDPQNQDAFIFANPDFGAPAVCLMEEKASFTIGSCGSIVTIPCKHYGIVMPLNNAAALEKLPLLSVIVVKFYNGQPGNITTDYYWYYENAFHLLPEKPSPTEEGYMAISLPQKLIELLNEQP